MSPSRPEASTSVLSAIEVAAIRKAFGPTVALQSASFVVAPGSVHALLGENGAGKSTLIKTLSGLLQPDEGTITIHGDPVRISSRRVAHDLGIQTAFQELTLVPTLSVTQNMLLPYEPVDFLGRIRSARSTKLVAEALCRYGLSHISPKAEVGTLSLPDRQKLEIVRAAMRDPKVLLLDEPTSALSGRDIAWLGDIIEMQKKRGTAVLFISHRLPEVRLYCDSITILRNGKSVGSFQTEDISDAEVIERIIGRSLEALFPPRTQSVRASSRPLVRMKHVSAGKAKNVSFEMRPGETIGVAALQGMGQLDLFKAMSGDAAVAEGSIEIEGKDIVFHAPADAIDSAIGVSFVPEERKTEALFLKMDGTFNATLPILSRFSRLGIPDSSAEKRIVSGIFGLVEVASRAAFLPMAAFSGGNQQKVVLAKWLLAESKVLLLYDPTRGVDVGTKHEIYDILQAYTAKGGAVLLYSTEVEEIINLSDRVLVMYNGKIVRELSQETGDISEANLMRAALGHDHDLAAE